MRSESSRADSEPESPLGYLMNHRFQFKEDLQVQDEQFKRFLTADDSIQTGKLKIVALSNEADKIIKQYRLIKSGLKQRLK